MTQLQAALNYFNAHQSEFMQRYLSFLRIPSVSTDANRRTDMSQACDFLAAYLNRLGINEVRRFETPLHPILYAWHPSRIANAPTLLVYGHYDVQPADPLDEWSSDPFEPVQHGEYLYARGAADMKGGIMAILSALESALAGGDLGVNIKLLFEGEEEIGSPSLEDFIREKTEMLACDMILNPDAIMMGETMPTLVYGLRGLLYFELRVDGPKADLHSGVFGGNVANPAHVLADLIAKLHHPDGSVAAPGFYDKVLHLSEDDHRQINAPGAIDETLLNNSGVAQLFGEPEFTALERMGARPTLDVNGLYSGFIGEGAKTIIPAYAKAKISCRLVPHQDPDEVFAQIQGYLEGFLPPYARMTLSKIGTGLPYLAQDAPGAQNLVQAFEDTWKKPAVLKREGGSAPVTTLMQQILGVKTLLTGFILPDSAVHSPNERQHLPTWSLGTQALIRFFLSF